MNIGRNEPCLCGSGKKYKKCCLGQDGSKPGLGDMQNLMAEIRHKLETGELSTSEEARILPQPTS